VLGRSLLAAGKRAEAEAVLLAALAEHGGCPEAPALLLAHVELLVSAGRTQEGAVVAADLARRFPGSPESALAALVVAPGSVQAADSPPGLPGLPGVSYASTPQRLLPEAMVGTAAVEAAPRVQQPAPPAAQGAPPSAAPPEPSAVTRPEAAPAAPPAAPAAPLEPSAAAPSPKALLQTGSFRDPENAEYMVRDLKARGFPAEVVAARVGDSLYYRVLVGPAQSVADAQSLLVRLKEAGFEGMLYFP
jgi:cell division septation protein DedD